MAADFPEGSIVYLKTGSPPLTVEDIRTDEIISVAWFAGAELRRDAFHPDALVPEHLAADQNHCRAIWMDAAGFAVEDVALEPHPPGL